MQHLGSEADRYEGHYELLPNLIRSGRVVRVFADTQICNVSMAKFMKFLILFTLGGLDHAADLSRRKMHAQQPPLRRGKLNARYCKEQDRR